MNLFDLFIIYLACGAPFGVHHFISRADRPFTSLLESSLYAFFWILILPGYFHRHVKGLLTSEEESVNETGDIFHGYEAARVVKKIDESSRTSSGYPGIYTVREAVERYFGISGLLAEDKTDEKAVGNGIFGISGHPSPDLGAACLRRRNRRELERHHSEASEDLVNLCVKIASDSEFPGPVISSFAELFTIFKDGGAAAELKRTAGKISAPVSSGSIKEREQSQWETSRLIPRKQEHIPLGMTDMTMISSLQNED
jgi:hypothetical protein